MGFGIALLLLPFNPQAKELGAINVDMKRLATLDAQQTQTEKEMRVIRGKLLEQGEEIATWKSRQAHSNNPFISYRLKNLLKSAHELANQLKNLENQKRKLSSARLALRQKLAESIDEGIALLGTELGSKDSTATETQALKEKLQLLEIQRRKLNTTEIPWRVVLGQEDYQRPSDGDSWEELQEKMAFLADLEDRLKANLQQLKTHIQRMRRRERILYETALLLDEESFFAEPSFAKTETTNTKVADATEGNTIEAKNTTKEIETAAPTSDSATPNTDSTATDTPSGVDDSFSAAADGEPGASAGDNGELPVALPDKTNGGITTDVVAANALDTPIRRLQLEGVASKGIDRTVLLNARLADLLAAETTLQDHLDTIRKNLQAAKELMRRHRLIEEAIQLP